MHHGRIALFTLLLLCVNVLYWRAHRPKPLEPLSRQEQLNKEMITAIYDGDARAFVTLLKWGADPNARGYWDRNGRWDETRHQRVWEPRRNTGGPTALMLAVFAGRIESVRALLSRASRILVMPDDSYYHWLSNHTILVFENDVSEDNLFADREEVRPYCCRTAVAAGWSEKMIMRRRRTALLTLCLLTAPIIGMGLWLRAERRQYTLNRQLIAALVKGNDKKALALVEAGADPNTRYTPTPVPSLLQLVRQLFHRTPPPVNNSPTAFSIACGAEWNDESATITAQLRRLDAPQLVQAMLIHGAKVNVQDKDRETPLLWAVSFNRRNMVGVLLEHGADANARGIDEETPLYLAVLINHPNIVPLLLEHGVNVNAKDEDGKTALMAAASVSADPNTVRLLLKYGADVNAKDEDEETALLCAMQFISSPKERLVKECIRQLLAHGADPNHADIGGNTPLLLAQRDKRLDIVSLLRQAGARK